jgi:predicted lysophospholipase L1 biosynthesis ABC-type transport system permease subunit
LQFFKDSVDSSLDTKAKVLLGADLGISSRFPITQKQKEDIKSKLPEVKSYSEGLSTVSMISAKDRARLMEVVKINEGYPYYGGLLFKDSSTYPQEKVLPKADEVWAYKEALELLGLKLGDRVKIGKESFTIKKIIEEDSLKTVSFSGFMPKIYMSEEGLEKSGLLQFGSTARHKLHFAFKQKLDNDTLEEIENKLEKSIDQDLRVLSPNDGKDRLLRVLKFITNFLSLVSLVSFFLGLVGLIYLYSGFLKKHRSDIDILSDLGLSKKALSLTYITHLFVLIAVATVVVFSLMALSAHFLVPVVERLVDFSFNLSLDYLFFLKSLVVLVLLSLSIGLPLILPLLQKERSSFFKMALSFTPFILLLLLISHFVTPAKSVGLLFAVAILILITTIFAVASFVLKRFDFSGHLENLSLSLALKNIIRERKTSLSLFTAILLCTTLFSLIPQTGASLSTALSESASERPRFFVVDAREEQIEDIKKEVEAKGARLENISPMIRGRIVEVNGVDFKDSDSENSELKNRAVNLSYRERLKKSEEIVEGREFSGVYDSEDFSKPIEVSVEKRYANRRGIELGDALTFDVLGLELKGVVVNIRSVEWTEFVPNFFFILQDGALNDAPKTMLATISAGEYDPSSMILNLSDTFPNLTVIDVKSLFETFASLVKSVTAITDNMSLYSVIIGLIMSFIIIQYQMNLQKNNILRLKMIGVKNKTIRNSFLLEYGLISFVASSFGIILGSIGSFTISSILFESYWDFRPDVLMLYFFFIPMLTIFVVALFTSKVIHQKENLLFGE